jgi:hypothetical protein
MDVPETVSTRHGRRLLLAALAALTLTAAGGCIDPSTRPPHPGTTGTTGTTQPAPAIPGLIAVQQSYAHIEPGPTPRLVVRLLLVLDASQIPGTPRLVKAEPQGINPDVLLLRLETEPPPPGAIGTIKASVCWEGDAVYDLVTVLPLGLDLVPEPVDFSSGGCPPPGP